jgi:ribosome-binding factor A
MERAAKVRDTRDAFGWLAKVELVPSLTAIKVYATPLAKDRRWKQDVGACFPAVKAAIDGLVDASVVPDDSPEFVRSLTFFPTHIGDVDGLRIVIEEVDKLVVQ